MKFAFVLLSSVLTFSAQAHALDCTKFSTELGKFICADQELKKSDDVMSAAYISLMRKVKDKDFRLALVKSQRRWLAKRSEIGARYLDEPNPADLRTDPKSLLLKVTKNRADNLKSNALLDNLEKQKNLTPYGADHRFEGYEFECFFSPPPFADFEFECHGMWYRQNANRICTGADEWATGHLSYYRLVSELVGGKPKPKASCSYGYASSAEICPGTDENEAIAHWNTNPRPNDNFWVPFEAKPWKYDPDVDISDADYDWVDQCLADATYPPVIQSRADKP
jgi:uncharacterized protein YecT (DUF1311 family)